MATPKTIRGLADVSHATPLFHIMTQTQTDSRTAHVQLPYRGGTVATVKRYGSMLVSTERGRWTILFATMLGILENTIYGSGPEAIAGISGTTVHWYLDVLTIVPFAFLLLLTADLFQYVYYTERNGGEF